MAGSTSFYFFVNGDKMTMNRTPDYTDLEYMSNDEYVDMMRARKEGRMVDLQDYFVGINPASKNVYDTPDGKKTGTKTTTTKPPAPKIPYVSVELSDEATTFLYSVIDEAKEWIIALMGTYTISDKGINFVVEDFVLPMQERSSGTVEMVKFDVAEKLWEKQQLRPEMLYIGIAHLHPRSMTAFFSTTDKEEIESQKALLPVGLSIVFSPFQKKFISSGDSYEPIEYALKVWVNNTTVDITDHDCHLGNVDKSMIDFYIGDLQYIDVLTAEHLEEKGKCIIGKELGFDKKYMKDYTHLQVFAVREFINNDFTEEDIKKVVSLYDEALKRKVKEDEGNTGK